MMLFLDDLPLRLGAYHPLGTNNIVLNRSLIHIVEVATKLAEMGPWALLKDIPLDVIDVPKRVMEIVKDFEKATERYIV